MVSVIPLALAPSNHSILGEKTFQKHEERQN